MATPRLLLAGVAALILLVGTTAATDAAAGPAQPGSAPGGVQAASRGRSFYLSPRGSDSNSGSSRSPWRTISRASRSMRAGDTLYVRGGTYTGQGGTWRGGSGTSTRPITIRNYPGDHPVFDGAGRSYFLWLQGSTAYLRLTGLRITGYHPANTGVIILTDRVHHVYLEWLSMVGNVGDDQEDHLIYLAANAVRDIYIRWNVLAGIRGGCIHLYHAPNARRVTIRYNLIKGCEWGVIVTSRASGIAITKNTFVDNAVGVDVWPGTSKVTIRDNVFSAGSRAHDPAVGVWVRSLAALAYEDYNLYSARGGAIALGSATNGRIYSVLRWRGITRFGNHSRQGDARFVSSVDYRLRSTSPARRAASDQHNMGRY